MSITVTEKAVQAVKRFKEEKHKSGETDVLGKFLRWKIVAGGCSGHESQLFLDDKFDESKDSKYNFYGEDFVVDKKSELYMEGATLDFVETLEQSGFNPYIPAAKKTCGCGHSFQF